MLLQEFADIYSILEEAFYHPADKIKAWKVLLLPFGIQRADPYAKVALDEKLPKQADYLEKLLKPNGTFSGKVLAHSSVVLKHAQVLGRILLARLPSSPS